mmetsp:Transcript_3819/g.5005  ORF Transcript_3819/g.5005 Transcript_3819/m.5005 type:complete len:80 (+) Transcript_3819:519-758(+)
MTVNDISVVFVSSRNNVKYFNDNVSRSFFLVSSKWFSTGYTKKSNCTVVAIDLVVGLDEGDNDGLAESRQGILQEIGQL